MNQNKEKPDMTDVEEEVSKSSVRFNAALDRLERSVEHGIDAAADAVGLAKEPVAIAKELGNRVESSLNDTMRSTEEVIKESGTRILSDLQKATGGLLDEALTFADDRRVVALATAFSVGFLAAYLLFRRSLRVERTSGQPAA